MISKGQAVKVNFDLTPNDLQFYNIDLKKILEPGEFQVIIGGNSMDLKEGRFQLK